MSDPNQTTTRVNIGCGCLVVFIGLIALATVGVISLLGALR